MILVGFPLLFFLAFVSKQRQSQYRIPISLSKQTIPDTEIFETTVSFESGKKQRLDQFLSSVYSEHTRSYISGLCDDGLVLVNNKSQSKSFKVSTGDRVTFTVVRKVSTKLTPENIPLNIIYEDEHLLCINKPNGMVVHPAVGSPNGTFVNALLFHLGSSKAEALLQAVPLDTISDEEVLREADNREELDLPETPEAAQATPASIRPGIVHRLDKGTTGVLIAGKTPSAVAGLSSLFARRALRKIYLAVCVGHPGDTTIFEPIGRSQKNRQLMCAYDGPPGKPAVSHVKTIAFDGRLSVCLVRIETGRTHQIRVHLQHRRTPILGDDAYGSEDWNRRYLRSHGIRRPLLHAYQTQFAHPFENKLMTLTAPLPEDMKALLAKIAPRGSGNDLGLGSILLDQQTGLLKGKCAVPGKVVQLGVENSDLDWDMERGASYSYEDELLGPWEREMAEADYADAESMDAMESGVKGFVPMDRLAEETEDWTALPLLQDDEE